MRLITFLTILSLLTGCAKQKEHDELKVMLNQTLEMEVSRHFDILDFHTSSAPGDYVETYRLKFSSIEFSKIKLNAKNSSNWKKLQSGETFQLSKKFNGHGFNQVIATISQENQEVRVQFASE